MNKNINTEIIKIDTENIDDKKLMHCAETIKRGGLVCFPTETVYGLGANAFDAKAVSNIFNAKGRPSDNPLIVHISGYDMLDLVADCGERQTDGLMRLGRAYWPGPVTVIVERDSSIPDCVSCGLPTVGIRMPGHPVARRLIELSGVPIAAPSANLSGKPSPSCAAHVIEDLMGRVDIIIDGGDCSVGVESTVLDISGEKPLILRPGAVTLEDIERILGETSLCDWRNTSDSVEEKPKSPGMKYTHYSPDADVVIYEGDGEVVCRSIRIDAMSCMLKGEKIGIMTVDENRHFYELLPNVLSLGSRGNPHAQAANLFKLLRRFDELGVEKVFAEAVPADGMGNAVMNRMFRAAGGNVKNAAGGEAVK